MCSRHVTSRHVAEHMVTHVTRGAQRRTGYEATCLSHYYYSTASMEMLEEFSSMSPEAAAEKYDALSFSFQFQDGCHLIDQLLKPQSGESILDVGCGTGRPTMVLAQQVTSSGRVVGVDPSAYRISVAQKKLTESGNKHVTFMEGTCADAIPLGPFDAVFSNYVLQWIQDHVSLLQDVYKCLRSGGRFAFLTVGKSPSVIALLSTKLFGKDEVAMFKQNYRTADCWRHICTQAGFIVEYCEDSTIAHTMPDVKTLMLWEGSSFAGMVKMPDVKHEDVVEWLKPYFIEDTGEIRIETEIVRALVRKP